MIENWKQLNEKHFHQNLICVCNNEAGDSRGQGHINSRSLGQRISNYKVDDEPAEAFNKARVELVVSANVRRNGAFVALLWYISARCWMMTRSEKRTRTKPMTGVKTETKVGLQTRQNKLLVVHWLNMMWFFVIFNRLAGEDFCYMHNSRCDTVYRFQAAVLWAPLRWYEGKIHWRLESLSCPFRR